MQGTCYRVLLIDPTGGSPAEVVYQAESRDEADAWVEAWEEEPLELVAVVWPSWAALPQAAAFATADVATGASDPAIES